MNEVYFDIRNVLFFSCYLLTVMEYSKKTNFVENVWVIVNKTYKIIISHKKICLGFDGR